MKKAYESLLITQTVGMYLIQVPIVIITILLNVTMNETLKGQLIRGLVVAMFIIMALVFPIALANIVIAFVSAFTKERNPSKITMICKLVLIPWFLFNFYICFVLFAGFLNPFLFWAIPAMVSVMVFTTYVYMFAMSTYDIAFFINRLIKKKINKKAPLIVATIFLFIFCLDIVGSIIFFVYSKEIE